MTVVPGADHRRVTTPNATMTTCASPSQGGSSLAMWRVEMHPGAEGPEHVMDAEQVWTVLDGAAAISIEGRRHEVEVGDTVVLAPGLTRRIMADPVLGLTAIAVGVGGSIASGPGREPVVPPWIA